MSRDVRALDAQDLFRCLQELAEVFEEETWARQQMTGAMVGQLLRSAVKIGSRRNSLLSTRLRVVVRRTLRRQLPALPESEPHTG